MIIKCFDLGSYIIFGLLNLCEIKIKLFSEKNVWKKSKEIFMVFISHYECNIVVQYKSLTMYELCITNSEHPSITYNFALKC